MAGIARDETARKTALFPTNVGQGAAPRTEGVLLNCAALRGRFVARNSPYRFKVDASGFEPESSECPFAFIRFDSNRTPEEIFDLGLLIYDLQNQMGCL